MLEALEFKDQNGYRYGKNKQSPKQHLFE